METVSVKFQENILKKIDTTIKKNNFNSRTEFIREAVRDKLSEVEKEVALKKLMSFYGKAKTRTSEEEWERIRVQVGNEMFEEYKKSLKKHPLT